VRAPWIHYARSVRLPPPLACARAEAGLLCALKLTCSERAQDAADESVLDGEPPIASEVCARPPTTLHTRTVLGGRV
jgi:hypothetical protein